MDIIDFTKKLEDGEFDDELLAYSKTAEFQYYNQPYFSQYKMNDRGVIIFTKTDVELIPIGNFKDGL